MNPGGTRIALSPLVPGGVRTAKSTHAAAPAKKTTATDFTEKRSKPVWVLFDNTASMLTKDNRMNPNDQARLAYAFDKVKPSTALSSVGSFAELSEPKPNRLDVIDRLQIPRIANFERRDFSTRKPRGAAGVLVLFGLDRSTDRPREEERTHARVRSERRLLEAQDRFERDLDAALLAALADRRIRKELTGIGAAAGDRPEAGVLLDEEIPRTLAYHSERHENNGNANVAHL